MKRIFTVLLAASFFSPALSLCSAEKKAADSAKPAPAKTAEKPKTEPPPPAPSGPTKLSFRSGELLSAEVSSAAVSVANLNKFDPSSLIKQKAYAALVVKMEKGRSIGTFDYALKDGGSQYDCVAVREGADGKFDASKWEHKDAEGKKYTLLFVVNASSLGKNPFVKYTLKNKLLDNCPDVKDIPFRNMGAKAFSPGTIIPDSGNIGVVFQEKKPEEKKADDKKAAAAAPAKKTEEKKTDPKATKK